MADSALLGYTDELLRLAALAPRWSGRKLQAFAAYYRGLDRWRIRREIYDFLVEHKRTATIIPMAHGKSTTVPRTLAVAFPCFDRNITMMVPSEAMDRSRKISRGARNELAGGGHEGRIREDFAIRRDPITGEVTPYPFQGPTWTETAWTVRGQDPRIDHPTCIAYGLGSKLIGSRCDVILPDDVISLHNSQTEFQRDKTWTWMNTHIISRLDRSASRPWCGPGETVGWPYGTIHGVGNHFDPRDYFVRLKEAASVAQVRSEELGIHLEAFEFFERGGYTDAARTTPILPELYTPTDLEQMRLDLGNTIFELCVMNNPSGLVNLPFPEEFNRYWTENPAEVIPGRVLMRPQLRKLRIVGGIDVGGENAGDALSAISILGFDRRALAFYWLDYIYGNWSTPEFFDHIWNAYLRWKPKALNMEAAPQRRLVESLVMEYPKLTEVMKPIKPGSRSKDIRIIDALQPPHQQRRFYFPLSEEHREAVVWFNHFPGIALKDVPDSMEMACRGLTDLPPRTPRTPGISVGGRM